MITISAFKWVPPFARGQVRDLRVRWACEEAALPYRTRLLGMGDQSAPEYRRWQPFGQVPAFEEDGLKLFESGAILLHIGERSETLLPREANERARATAWVFAALNSVEFFVQQLGAADAFFADQDWVKGYKPVIEDMTRKRLQGVADALGDQDYLEGRFTAGDLMMTTVLRILDNTALVKEMPALAAYKARCEARPAFQRALKAQLDDFADD
jgi:glutathione S-transferase